MDTTDQTASPICLEELLRDAESSTRLTAWETEFMDSLRGRFLMSKGRLQPTEKQMEVLRKIERKIYAIG